MRAARGALSSLTPGGCYIAKGEGKGGEPIRRAYLISILIAAAGVAGGLFWSLSPSPDGGQTPSGSAAPDMLAVLEEASDDGFAGPPADWTLSLPGDHGRHPESRTESWQIAAHLADDTGRGFGVQFSFMRLGLRSGAVTGDWAVRDLNRAHVAFLDASAEEAIGQERFARSIPGLAGFDPKAGELRLDDWSLRFGRDGEGDLIALDAPLGQGGRIALVMRAEKPPLSLAPEGGEAPFVGYAMTRLAVEGRIDRGGSDVPVSGTAWFDHLWGELPLPGAGPVAWDRLQLHLEDGSELSVVRSRRTDGRGTPSVNGFVVTPDGTALPFDAEQLEMTALRNWRDPARDAVYPLDWRLTAPGLDLSIVPLADAQLHDFATPLWSGAVRVSGQSARGAVSGLGTLQLTGYGAP